MHAYAEELENLNPLTFNSVKEAEPKGLQELTRQELGSEIKRPGEEEGSSVVMYAKKQHEESKRVTQGEGKGMRCDSAGTQSDICNYESNDEALFKQRGKQSTSFRSEGGLRSKTLIEAE